MFTYLELQLCRVQRAVTPTSHVSSERGLLHVSAKGDDVVSNQDPMGFYDLVQYPIHTRADKIFYSSSPSRRSPLENRSTRLDGSIHLNLRSRDWS